MLSSLINPVMSAGYLNDYSNDYILEQSVSSMETGMYSRLLNNNNHLNNRNNLNNNDLDESFNLLDSKLLGSELLDSKLLNSNLLNSSINNNRIINNNRNNNNRIININNIDNYYDYIYDLSPFKSYIINNNWKMQYWDNNDSSYCQFSLNQSNANNKILNENVRMYKYIEIDPNKMLNVDSLKKEIELLSDCYREIKNSGIPFYIALNINCDLFKNANIAGNAIIELYNMLANLKNKSIEMNILIQKPSSDLYCNTSIDSGNLNDSEKQINSLLDKIGKLYSNDRVNKLNTESKETVNWFVQNMSGNFGYVNKDGYITKFNGIRNNNDTFKNIFEKINDSENEYFFINLDEETKPNSLFNKENFIKKINNLFSKTRKITNKKVYFKVNHTLKDEYIENITSNLNVIDDILKKFNNDKNIRLCYNVSAYSKSNKLLEQARWSNLRKNNILEFSEAVLEKLKLENSKLSNNKLSNSNSSVKSNFKNSNNNLSNSRLSNNSNSSSNKLSNGNNSVRSFKNSSNNLSSSRLSNKINNNNQKLSFKSYAIQHNWQSQYWDARPMHNPQYYQFSLNRPDVNSILANKKVEMYKNITINSKTILNVNSLKQEIKDLKKSFDGMKGISFLVNVSITNNTYKDYILDNLNKIYSSLTKLDSKDFQIKFCPSVTIANKTQTTYLNNQMPRYWKQNFDDFTKKFKQIYK